jgi:hypothetical protein
MPLGVHPLMQDADDVHGVLCRVLAIVDDVRASEDFAVTLANIDPSSLPAT